MIVYFVHVSADPELSPSHHYLSQTNRLFSHSAADLSLNNFEVAVKSSSSERASSKEEQTPACSSLLSASTNTILAAVALPSTTACGAAAPDSASDSSSCCGGQSGASRKPSPIRAYLTPPLMRKRNKQTRAQHNEDQDVLSTSLPNRTPKSPSFFSILKVYS